VILSTVIDSGVPKGVHLIAREIIIHKELKRPSIRESDEVVLACLVEHNLG
jgi:hypothetical protein